MKRNYRRSAAFESLEGRTLFALTITPFTDPDSGAPGLRIIGNGSNDTLNITEDPVGGTTAVSGTGISGTRTFGEIELWDVRTNGGTDVVNWTVQSGYTLDNRSIFVDLGSGNDTLNFNAPMGSVAFSAVLLDVVGGTGNDTATVNHPTTSAESRFNLQVAGGDGNDRLNLPMDTVDAASSVDVSADLGSGSNTVEASLNSVNDVSSATFNIDGGDGTGSVFDTVNLTLGDSVNGDLTVNGFLGGGNDRMTVDLATAFDVETPGEVRLNLQGESGDDVLTVRSNQVPAEQPFIGGLLDINQVGGSGNDFMVVDLRKTLNTGNLDGLDLDGRLRLRQQGQTGNDTMITDLLFKSGSTAGRADIIVTGDSGNDTVGFSLRDNSGAGVTYAGNAALLDGGADIDTVTFLNVGGLVRVQRFDN